MKTYKWLPFGFNYASSEDLCKLQTLYCIWQLLLELCLVNFFSNLAAVSISIKCLY